MFVWMVFSRNDNVPGDEVMYWVDKIAMWPDHGIYSIPDEVLHVYFIV